MPANTCNTCNPPVACCAGTNLFFYNLQQNPVLTNAETGFIFDCPPGFNCDPNVFPLPITVPPGTVTMPITFPITDPNPPPLTLNCPAGGVITRAIPPGSTPAQILALAASMVSLCTQQIGKAKGTPAKNKMFHSNGACIEPCAPTANFKVNGNLPSGFFIGGNSFCVQAGIFTSFASQVDADAKAAAGVRSVFSGLIAAGTIQCGWFSAALSFDCPNSSQIVNVPAGQFFSDQAAGGSQADADAQALAFAKTQCVTNIFAALVWDNPPDTQVQQNGGTATQSPLTGATTTVATAVPAVANAAALLDNTNGNAVLNYAGPQLNCNAKIVITGNGADVTHGSFFILIQQDGGTILFQFNLFTPGTYNLPFIITATAGSTITVEVHQSSSPTVGVVASFLNTVTKLTSS
jgi:hypothetical protein